MSFDAKREELLKRLNTIQKEKDTKRINQAVKARMKANEKEPSRVAVVKTEEVVRSEKPRVLLYGSVRIFLGTLKSILGPYCEVMEFESAERAADCIIDEHIPIVMMDMDPPNDWKLCHDLFTTGRTMYPDIEYILFHKEKIAATHVEILQAQGAHVLSKPIDQVGLVQLIKEIMRRQEANR